MKSSASEGRPATQKITVRNVEECQRSLRREVRVHRRKPVRDRPSSWQEVGRASPEGAAPRVHHVQHSDISTRRQFLSNWELKTSKMNLKQKTKPLERRFVAGLSSQRYPTAMVMSPIRHWRLIVPVPVPVPGPGPGPVRPTQVRMSGHTSCSRLACLDPQVHRPPSVFIIPLPFPLAVCRPALTYSPAAHFLKN